MCNMIRFFFVFFFIQPYSMPRNLVKYNIMWCVKDNTAPCKYKFESHLQKKKRCRFDLANITLLVLFDNLKNRDFSKTALVLLNWIGYFGIHITFIKYSQSV